MRHSSKVSACRRGLNSHNAAQSRAPGHCSSVPGYKCLCSPCATRQRQCRVRYKCTGPLYRLEAAAYGQAHSAVAAKVCAWRTSPPTLPQEFVPRRGPQRAAPGVWCSSPRVAEIGRAHV